MPPMPPTSPTRPRRPVRAVRAALVILALAAGSLVAAATAAPAAPTRAAPLFKAPFPCGQSWTYSHHSGEVRLALDFVRNGGETAGTPVLASAAGTATRHVQDGGAGNYIVIDHGGGWRTYYFHLAAFSVPSGAQVGQGQQVGVTGSTGNSSGAHIHYEQLLNGVGQTIHVNGTSLAPYPGRYGEKSITSDNGCAGGTYWVDTFAQAPGYRTAAVSDEQGYLRAGTSYVYCKVWGANYTGPEGFNHWWLKTDLDVVYPGKDGRGAFVPAYFLSRWGNDEAKDNNGAVIPDC